MTEFIHIVCLDAPAPPDYGGAIDMYYKIVALSNIGKKIILHYFDYNQRGVKELEKYCSEINRYKRKGFFKSLSLTTPFIVASRIDRMLIQRLNADEHPIILEGIHCTGIIPFLNKRERITIRMHNNEPAYYGSLFKTAKNFIEKGYFLIEKVLLQRYQHRMDTNLKLACLSQSDLDNFHIKYKFTNLHFIPCFLPWDHVNVKDGKGNYCLYHGNMAVPENEAAALWLIDNVYNQADIPLVIAGNGISNALLHKGHKNKNIRFVNNPSIKELDELIRDAQMHVLPSMNRTGVKLKLLHVLFEGRFILTNRNGIKGSGIDKEVLLAEQPHEYIKTIKDFFSKDFNKDELTGRINLLNIYDNERNARKLSEL